MDLKFQKSDIAYIKPLLREVQNQEQTQEVRLSDGMPDIGRILAGWGQVVVRSKEWRSDTAAFSGGIMTWVLYAPEDGTEPRVIESWLPFQTKFDLEGSSRDGQIRVQCLLRSVDARSVSARKVLIRCNVGVLGEAWVPDSASVGVPGKLPEDVQLLKESYPVRLPREAGEKTFLLDEELTLPTSAPQPEKLMYYTLTPRITDCKVVSGKLVFRGSGDLHVCYLCAEGKVHSYDQELLFSQFADLDVAVGADAQGDIRMGITSLEADLDEYKHLRVKCGLLAQYLVDDRVLLELIADAYSPIRPVEAEREMLELPVILEQKRIPITSHQSVQQEAREIVDVSFLPDFPRLRGSQEVQLELPGQFQVLYCAEDGNLQSVSSRTEDTMTFPSDPLSRVDAAILARERPVAMGGSSMEFRGEAQLLMQTTSLQGIPMVSGLELGEAPERDNSRPSVILRRAGTARLWDIAKSTGSTVEAIRAANHLDTEPAANEILLIPVS